MTRENKAGFAIAGVFLTLVGTVVTMKWRDPSSQRGLAMSVPAIELEPEPPIVPKVQPKGSTPVAKAEPAKKVMPPKPAEPKSQNPNALPAVNVFAMVNGSANDVEKNGPPAANDSQADPAKPTPLTLDELPTFEEMYSKVTGPMLSTRPATTSIALQSEQGSELIPVRNEIEIPSPSASTQTPPPPSPPGVDGPSPAILPAMPGQTPAPPPYNPNGGDLTPPAPVIPPATPAPSLPGIASPPIPGVGDSTPTPVPPGTSPLPPISPTPEVPPGRPLAPFTRMGPPKPTAEELSSSLVSPAPTVKPAAPGIEPITAPPPTPGEPPSISPAPPEYVSTPTPGSIGTPPPPILEVKLDPTPMPIPSVPLPPKKESTEKTSSDAPAENSRFVPSGVSISAPRVGTKPSGTGPDALNAANIAPTSGRESPPNGGPPPILPAKVEELRPVASMATLTPVPSPASGNQSGLPTSALPIARSSENQVGGGIPAAAPNRPKVNRFDTRGVDCQQGDTWESLSERHLLTKGYAQALRAFNVQYSGQKPSIRGGQPPQRGDTVFVPSTQVLHEDFREYLPK